jgi:hypothetical protein
MPAIIKNAPIKIKIKRKINEIEKNMLAMIEVAPNKMKVHAIQAR